MKQKIERAFEVLRKEGFVAEQNWKCCQGCGMAALPKGTEKYVFYHAQDEENLMDNSTVFLAFGGGGTKIADALINEGLIVNWNGSESMRIQVLDEARYRFGRIGS